MINTTNTNLTSWITEKFISASAESAAKALAGLATHEAVQLLKPLKAEYMVLCLNPMQADKAAAILRRLPARQGAHVLARLEVRKAAEIFSAFSVPQREKMKTLLPTHFVQLLEKSSAWKEGSAAAMMSTDFLSFRTDNKLSDIVEKLKTLPRKKLPTACFVTDKNGKLKGFIRTAELAFYAPVSTAGSVMSEAQALLPEQPAEKAQAILDQGQPLVAVVDQAGILLGVLGNTHAVAPIPAKKRFGWF
ncbi:MAG: magnesium transporter [Elusimicrobiaceae bacterium]|nr:magnesium transporter [Elusimicrobiaceae bacterium]